MRSDHLAKHTKTHENKAKKMIAKKGEKSEKARGGTISSHEEDRKAHVPAIKQEKIDDEEMKPAVFSANNIYTDTPKIVLDNYHEASQSASLPGQPSKASLEDYYHPYQYQYQRVPEYASNYFHQSPRFYQDKNYFYGVMNDQSSRGLFSTTVPQTNFASSTQLESHQNEFYHQTSNFQAPSNSHVSQNSYTSNNYQ